jgi:hypothetical protein
VDLLAVRTFLIRQLVLAGRKVEISSYLAGGDGDHFGPQVRRDAELEAATRTLVVDHLLVVRILDFPAQCQGRAGDRKKKNV